MTPAAPLEAASAATASFTQQSMIISLWGFDVNLMSVLMFGIIFGLLFLFYRIQATDKLDFADMITKDGRAVSLTKVLQLVGGITATWIMVKYAASGTLNETLFGLYLAYVGGIEGYSKFVSAKYKYNEKSVRDADVSLEISEKPPKV